MKHRLLMIVSLSLALLLVLVACGTEPVAEAPTDEPTVEMPMEEPPMEEPPMEEPPMEEPPMEEPPMEQPPVEEPITDLPGVGVTVNAGRASWDTGWFQAALFSEMLTELGYQVESPATLDNPVFYLSAARGDLDFWPNGWFPLHNTYIEDENVRDNVELVGFEVRAGALQGYLIDKRSAEEFGITNLEDFRDPDIAAAFDSTGDGRADLVGCNPGWGCELVIEHHLDAFDLRDSINHVQGEYSVLMADTVARFQRGEPILFYTWTPNWTIAQLPVDEDVVWIGVPFSSLPEEQGGDEVDTTAEGVAGCVADPCVMGFPPNDIRVVANTDFLENNPAARRLFELVEIPLADIAAQNELMIVDGEDSDADIQRHAQEWMDTNRDLVDEWLAEARTVAN